LTEDDKTKADKELEKNNFVRFTTRLTPFQHKQLEKYCAAKNITMADLFRGLADKTLKESDPTLLQGEVPFNFEATEAILDKVKDERKSLMRSIKDWGEFNALGQRVGLKLDYSNLQECIPKLYSSGVDDVSTFVRYLRACSNKRELEAQLGIKPKAEGEEEQADRTKDPDNEMRPGGQETYAEYNKRCYANLAAIEKHNHEVNNDPLNMIRMITDNEYGSVYLDDKQQKILEAYLKEHHLPYPKYKGKSGVKEGNN
jgi:hypothetical protein